MYFFTPEAFFGSFKRDDVYQACLETLEAVRRPGPAWIGHDNQAAPHSALGMQSPAEFYAAWLVTNEQRPVQIKRGSTPQLSQD
jgi:transposase InsO family protein